MKNSKSLFDDFVNKITIPESKEEIRSIAYLVFHHLFDISRTEILTGKPLTSAAEHQERINNIIQKINLHMPVQYILGEAEFYGRAFKVDPSVLIPRPETEELVREILNIHGSPFSDKDGVTILDIGTGSGCIPITLALEIQGSNVFATDVSENALTTARINADRLKAPVRFSKNDILKEELPYGNLDIVVSNPPYIPLAEKETLKDNVTSFEPHLALFVNDTNPLLFYNAITKKASLNLRKDGLLIFEIHEQFGHQVAEILKTADFNNIEILNDLSGKPRIVKGFKK